MSTYMVWYDIGVSEKVKANSLRDCADKVRQYSKKKFLIVPLDEWRDFQKMYGILTREGTRGRR